jgi:hypothetical protein
MGLPLACSVEAAVDWIRQASLMDVAARFSPAHPFHRLPRQSNETHRRGLDLEATDD